METPSYYAVIPANVRYSSITPNAKLLYGEITALCSKSGLCWATNGYFARLYDCSERTAQRWLHELSDAGFIVLCSAPNGARGMRLNLLSARDDKNVHPTDKSVVVTPDKNVTQNNTRENNTSNLPQPPKGAVGWESDLSFGEVCDAYARLSPTRVDKQKAWAVWLEQQLSGHSERLLAVLPTFAASDSWKKEGGKFIPSLSKWLANGAWRSAQPVGVQVSAEELANRERIHREGFNAYARVEADKRLGRQPEAADVEAVRLWREQQMNQ